LKATLMNDGPKSYIQKANDRWMNSGKKKYIKGYKQRNLNWMPKYVKPSDIIKKRNDKES